MTHHDVNLTDSAGLEDKAGGAPAEPVRQTYEVVNPLFKRGKLHKARTKIDLDPATAAAFLETGDIKEIKR